MGTKTWTVVSICLILLQVNWTLCQNRIPPWVTTQSTPLQGQTYLHLTNGKSVPYPACYTIRNNAVNDLPYQVDLGNDNLVTFSCRDILRLGLPSNIIVDDFTVSSDLFTEVLKCNLNELFVELPNGILMSYDLLCNQITCENPKITVPPLPVLPDVDFEAILSGDVVPKKVKQIPIVQKLTPSVSLVPTQVGSSPPAVPTFEAATIILPYPPQPCPPQLCAQPVASPCPPELCSPQPCVPVCPRAPTPCQPKPCPLPLPTPCPQPHSPQPCAAVSPCAPTPCQPEPCTLPVPTCPPQPFSPQPCAPVCPRAPTPCQPKPCPLPLPNPCSQPHSPQPCVAVSPCATTPCQPEPCPLPVSPQPCLTESCGTIFPFPSAPCQPEPCPYHSPPSSLQPCLPESCAPVFPFSSAPCQPEPCPYRSPPCLPQPCLPCPSIQPCSSCCEPEPMSLWDHLTHSPISCTHTPAHLPCRTGCGHKPSSCQGPLSSSIYSNIHPSFTPSAYNCPFGGQFYSNILFA